jgi:hypothetical protein
MEKVAWTELVVSSAAVAAAVALIPWFGYRATSAFALLGLVVCSLWFLRRRGPRVVVDERDREIEQQATKRGVEAAWMTTFLALIILGFWSNIYNDNVLSTRALGWLVWIQFAIFVGVKGLAGVISYRRQRHAA